MVPIRLRHYSRWRPLSSFLNSYRRYSSSTSRRQSNIFNVSPEVEEAVLNGKPVVALETTIYTHGFPYPDNVALASHLESVVRVNGGIPATIGVLNGIARVGLDPEELIELASAAGKKETMKISRRDLPYITGLGIAGKEISGGTTIAGTMILAKMAGIEIFGTGGLGGVHRGGEITMDISADLTELGRTPITVISSGCKSFLDIPRTLEYLETQGVSVSTFADGRTGNIDLPAFWTRESGVKSPSVVKDEKEAAAIIYARRLLDLQSGIFFANPIPAEHSIPKSEIDQAIEEAVRDAERQGIHGHANTPFILARIKQLTGGRSIPANRALIESNVARAAKVAVELSKLDSQSRGNDHASMPQASSGIHQPQANVLFSKQNSAMKEIELVKTPKQRKLNDHADILIAGSVAVDLSCDYEPLNKSSTAVPLNHTSNPAVISQSIGGVGHNVTTAAYLIGDGASVRLCSIVADDLAGKLVLSSLESRGLDTTAIKMLTSRGKLSERTAQYVSINDGNKDLVIAMADMGIIGASRKDFTHWQAIIDSSKAKVIVVDANWHQSVMHDWIEAAERSGALVAFEPVSVAKCVKLFPPQATKGRGDAESSTTTMGIYPRHLIFLTTPNSHELAAIHSAAQSNAYFETPEWWSVIDSLGIPSSGASLRLQFLTNRELVEEGIPQRMIQLLPYIPNIITKLGANGVVLAKLLPREDPLLSSPEGAPHILSRSLDNSEVVGGVYMRHFPAAELVDAKEIVSVNGVGDTFLGALVAGLARGMELDERLVSVAQKAAVLTLKSGEAVSPRVTELALELKSFG